MKKTTCVLVNFFLGLDPALPLFTTTNKDRKLDRTDAEFVDVLHTDALVEGKVERCGHIDFYMNGGLEQPTSQNLLLPKLDFGVGLVKDFFTILQSGVLQEYLMY